MDHCHHVNLDLYVWTRHGLTRFIVLKETPAADWQVVTRRVLQMWSWRFDMTNRTGRGSGCWREGMAGRRRTAEWTFNPASCTQNRWFRLENGNNRDRATNRARTGPRLEPAPRSEPGGRDEEDGEQKQEEAVCGAAGERCGEWNYSVSLSARAQGQNTQLGFILTV